MRSFIAVLNKLTCLLVLSSAGLFTDTRAQAHELQPTVADVRVSGQTLTLDLRLNIEALLADIDLDALSDTNDATNAENYDVLRALSAQELAARAPDLLAQWNALPLITLDGRAVELQSGQLGIPTDTDIELSRLSDWQLTAQVPQGGQVLRISWPDGAGAIVVRQQGVDAPFTGYLEGGDTSADIILGDGDEMTFWQAFVSYFRGR